ncbi:CidA/LrgA family holin-like protein [Massilibacterium senegalense]|uniref:CidA/LrgA family holin-like protein n=1 Tax=Massilibacterium senegalense TaxID=1632858 RepID=UPI00078168BC|nr:CidA/LrgA family holin-like protein [Massilibacterium senegalense]
MKKLGKTVAQLIVICFFYQLGVWIQQAFHLFIPGSIIGMFLLFLLLMTNILRLEWIEDGSHVLLRHLPLLFLPATIGIINYKSLASFYGLQLIFIVIVSSIMVFVISGKTAQYFAKKQQKRGEQHV